MGNRGRAPAFCASRAATTLRFLTVVLGLAAAAGPLEAQHAGQYEQADVEYGARLYAGRCVACHGESGDAMPGANLRSGQFRHAATDRDLSNLIRNGIPGTAMTATEYTDSERTALVAYLRNMNNFELGGLAVGDAERGRTLFEGKGQCGDCHRVNGKGPRFAPDLSDIGAIRTASTLERSLIDPDAAMVPINRPVRAVTRDGTVINGRRVNEDTFTVQLIDEQERLLSLEKSELREYTIRKTATMPSYADAFTDAERADLLAYLLSLKGFE